MSELPDLEMLVCRISEFTRMSKTDKIKLFAWYVCRLQNQKRFSTADIINCFDSLHLERPGNVSQLLTNLSSGGRLLKDRDGFFLERSTLAALDAKYGQRETTVAVDKLLVQLPELLPNVAEREFLKEALSCFRVGAFRAAIVMTWNLAFDHLCKYIFVRHLDKFNAQWPIRFPKLHAKARVEAITEIEDFSEIKESEVIEIAKAASIISPDLAKIFDEKLTKRNSAAHPSHVVFTTLTAENYIDELIRNGVVRVVI